MIKWEPPSAEELAARVAGGALVKERARLQDGKFRGDDPSTDSVNEAWVKKPRRRKEV